MKVDEIPKTQNRVLPGRPLNQALSCPVNSGIPRWEFECLDCCSVFEVDVPNGPREERALRCDHCGGDQIKRINIPDLQAAACGG